VNIFKNIIDKVVDAFSSSKEFKINDYDETNYDDKIVPYNEILESKNGILIAILSKIAKSDGVISVNESNYISKQIDSFQIRLLIIIFQCYIIQPHFTTCTTLTFFVSHFISP
jgi:hypothetical protein